MKWLDTRIVTPKPNKFDIYSVTFLYCGSVFLGRAEWIPTNNYTTGEWGETVTTNGNILDNTTILYWAEHPVIPELPALESRK